MNIFKIFIYFMGEYYYVVITVNGLQREVEFNLDDTFEIFKYRILKNSSIKYENYDDYHLYNINKPVLLDYDKSVQITAILSGDNLYNGDEITFNLNNNNIKCREKKTFLQHILKYFKCCKINLKY